MTGPIPTPTQPPLPTKLYSRRHSQMRHVSATFLHNVPKQNASTMNAAAASLVGGGTASCGTSHVGSASSPAAAAAGGVSPKPRPPSSVTATATGATATTAAAADPSAEHTTTTTTTTTSAVQHNLFATAASSSPSPPTTKKNYPKRPIIVVADASIQAIPSLASVCFHSKEVQTEGGDSFHGLGAAAIGRRFVSALAHADSGVGFGSGSAAAGGGGTHRSNDPNSESATKGLTKDMQQRHSSQREQLAADFMQRESRLLQTLQKQQADFDKQLKEEKERAEVAVNEVERQSALLRHERLRSESTIGSLKAELRSANELAEQLQTRLREAQEDAARARRANTDPSYERAASTLGGANAASPLDSAKVVAAMEKHLLRKQEESTARHQARIAEDQRKYQERRDELEALVLKQQQQQQRGGSEPAGDGIGVSLLRSESRESFASGMTRPASASAHRLGSTSKSPAGDTHGSGNRRGTTIAKSPLSTRSRSPQQASFSALSASVSGGRRGTQHRVPQTVSGSAAESGSPSPSSRVKRDLSSQLAASTNSSSPIGPLPLPSDAPKQTHPSSSSTNNSSAFEDFSSSGTNNNNNNSLPPDDSLLPNILHPAASSALTDEEFVAVAQRDSSILYQESLCSSVADSSLVMKDGRNGAATSEGSAAILLTPTPPPASTVQILIEAEQPGTDVTPRSSGGPNRRPGQQQGPSARRAVSFTASVEEGELPAPRTPSGTTPSFTTAAAGFNRMGSISMTSVEAIRTLRNRVSILMGENEATKRREVAAEQLANAVTSVTSLLDLLQEKTGSDALVSAEARLERTVAEMEAHYTAQLKQVQETARLREKELNDLFRQQIAQFEAELHAASDSIRRLHEANRSHEHTAEALRLRVAEAENFRNEQGDRLGSLHAALLRKKQHTTGKGADSSVVCVVCQEQILRDEVKRYYGTSPRGGTALPPSTTAPSHGSGAHDESSPSSTMRATLQVKPCLSAGGMTSFSSTAPTTTALEEAAGAGGGGGVDPLSTVSADGMIHVSRCALQARQSGSRRGGRPSTAQTRSSHKAE